MIDNYEIELAEENAVAHIQAMVFRLLAAKKITRAMLAERMDVSAAHVSQLLGDQPKNLSVKKAARLFHALGEELAMTCAGINALNRQADERHAQLEMDARPSSFDWFDSANGNASGSLDAGCDQLAAA